MDTHDDLHVTRSVRVPRRELDVSFSPSGGPGGQHANKTATRVELRFDVATSTAFTESQRARLVDKVGEQVRIVVDEHRSQSRNRALAEERLVERLAAGLHQEAPRRATRPTAGSKRRRLDAKKRRSDVKAQRRRPTTD
jgi:ribosome-associated protein